MNNYTNLNGREDLLQTITELEKELAARQARKLRWLRSPFDTVKHKAPGSMPGALRRFF